jgi:L-asparaginase/Glu-tRNA(Gln) amidotransferase subunit D
VPELAAAVASYINTNKTTTIVGSNLQANANNAVNSNNANNAVNTANTNNGQINKEM